MRIARPPSVLTLLLLAVAAVAIPTSAQPYPGDAITVTSTGGLWRVAKNGTNTSLADLATTSYGVTMNYANDAIIWTGFGSSSTSSTLTASINSYQSGANTTVFSTKDFFIYDVAVNQNGEVVFTGGDKTKTPAMRGLFKWMGGTSVSTIATSIQIGSNGTLNGGLGVNIMTGNYLVPNGSFSSPGQIWDVAANGTSTSVITSPSSPSSGRYSISQDRRSGDIFQSRFSNFLVVQSGTQFSKTLSYSGPGSATTDYYYAIRIDRASVPDTLRRLWAIYQSSSTSTNYFTEVADPGGTPTYTTTGLASGVSGTTYEMIFEGERNIGTMRTGPGAYRVNFSFPGEGGARYVAAISASGFKPGITLADGRHIALQPDALFFTSVANLLKPFFDSGPGVLGKDGSAQGSIALGKDNLGARVWMAALTLTSTGVGTVSDPIVLNL